MNDSTAAATNPMARSASDVAPSAGLHQRLVMAALEQMDSGHLRLQLPDGTVRHLGTLGHAHSATRLFCAPPFLPGCCSMAMSVSVRPT